MAHKILHVEDNADDAMLVALAFRRAGCAVELQLATDGDKAMAALRPDSAEPLPVCVLLDMKLPTMSGLDVLSWIRSQGHLKGLPVVILSSSGLPEDINRSYALGANSYLVKPSDLDSLIELAKTIDLYWLQTNIRSFAPA
jgi:CheY-like chemotaxis protein